MGIGRRSVPVRHRHQKALDRVQSIGINQALGFLANWLDWDYDTGLLEFKTLASGVYTTWFSIASDGEISSAAPVVWFDDTDVELRLGQVGLTPRPNLVLGAQDSASSYSSIIGLGLDHGTSVWQTYGSFDGTAFVAFGGHTLDGRLLLGAINNNTSNGESILSNANGVYLELFTSFNFSIGTSSVASITSAGLNLLQDGMDLNMRDSGEIQLGTGNDFTLTFNGTDTVGNMVAGDWVIQDGGTEVWRFTTSGAEVTGQAHIKMNTLTDGATINWDMDDGSVAEVTLAGNRTMAAPTNLKDGGTYILHVHQDATGSRTITWNAVFKWPGGTAPTLSTGASAHDIISFTSDGTNLYGVAALDFS